MDWTQRTLCCVCLALFVSGSAAAADSYWVEPFSPNGYWRLQGGWSVAGEGNLPSNSSLGQTGTVSGAIGIEPIRYLKIDLFEFGWRQYPLKVSGSKGQIDAFSFLWNFYYIPFPDWRVRPFVGIGPGLIYARGKVSQNKEDGVGFAWNARAGAEYRIIQQLSVVGEYRFLMDVGAINNVTPMHELMLGIQMNFH